VRVCQARLFRLPIFPRACRRQAVAPYYVMSYDPTPSDGYPKQPSDGVRSSAVPQLPDAISARRKGRSRMRRMGILTVIILLEPAPNSANRSRSRQRNDHAPVEGGNGAMVRTHMRHTHIPQCHAARLNDFYNGPISRVIMHAPLPCKTLRITDSRHSHLARTDGCECQYHVLLGKYPHAALY
jgi:hypothetical protein